MTTESAETNAAPTAAPTAADVPAADVPVAAYRSVAATAQRPWWALADGTECENCAHQGARCGDHH